MTLNHPPTTTDTNSMLQYLKCYWPDFDKTLNILTNNFFTKIFLLTQFFFNLFFYQNFLPKIFNWQRKNSWPNFFDQIFFWPNISFYIKFFFHQHFFLQNFFLNQTFSLTKKLSLEIFLTYIFFDQIAKLLAWYDVT